MFMLRDIKLNICRPVDNNILLMQHSLKQTVVHATVEY